MRWSSVRPRARARAAASCRRPPPTACPCPSPCRRARAPSRYVRPCRSVVPQSWSWPATLLLGPPGPQPARRLLLTQRALVEPQFHQEVQGLADGPPRPDAQQLHDLVPVQVGSECPQLLLLAELGDA